MFNLGYEYQQNYSYEQPSYRAPEQHQTWTARGQRGQSTLSGRYQAVSPAAALEQQRELAPVAAEQRRDLHKRPDELERHCTDVWCAVAFLVCLACLLHTCVIALTEGHPRRYMHMMDSDGNVCGYDQAVENLPYVYYCWNEGALDQPSIQAKVCVEECSPPPAACGEAQTSGEKMFLFARSVCMPKTEKLQRAAVQDMNLRSPHARMVMHMEEWIFGPKYIHLTTAPASLAMGFIVVKCIQRHARPLFRFGLVVCITVPIVTGFVFMFRANYPPYHGGSDQMLGTGDSLLDMLLGVALIVSGVIVLCIYCYNISAIHMAVKCASSACDCIFAVWGLLVEVVISSVLDIVGIGIWLFIFEHAYAYCKEKGGHHYYHLVILVVMGAWIHGIRMAGSTFAVMYSTEMWTHGEVFPDQENLPTCTTLSAYCKAFTYHFGTLCLGSFVIHVMWLPRVLVLAVVEVANMIPEPYSEEVKDMCCVDKVQHIKSVSHYLYMDVVLNGWPLFAAAEHAEEIVESDLGSGLWRQRKPFRKAYYLLEGATRLIQVVGISLISGTAAVVAWLSYYYIFPELQDVTPLKAVIFDSTVIGIIVALPFMFVFTDVAQTVLFYYAVQKRRMASPELGGEHGWLAWFISARGNQGRPDATQELFQAFEQTDNAGDAAGMQLPTGAAGLHRAAALSLMLGAGGPQCCGPRGN